MIEMYLHWIHHAVWRFVFLPYLWRQKYMNVCANLLLWLWVYCFHQSKPVLQEKHKRRMIHPKRYYSKLCFLLLLLLARKYLGNLFLKWFFSSIDAVLTCTFRDTFLLKPQLRRIQGICEYNDILYRVSLWLTSPVLWSNHNYFLLVLT